MGRNYSAAAIDTALSVAATSTANTVTVVGTVGFPTPPFIAAIIDAPGQHEVVLVTGVSGTVLTVTRGYDGTTAAAHPAAAVVRHVASAIDFREAALHIDATTGVHGVGAGAVVGTSTAQTLTNKDLTSPTNVFPPFITGNLVPTGVGFEWWSTAAPPSGYLMQDNGEYPIATYTALYNFLTSNGTAFPHGANTNGSGAAGSTHFRTPLRKGKAGVGYNSADTDFNAIGKAGGFKTHTLTTAEMPVHTHIQNGHFHTQTAHHHGAATGWAGGTGHGNFYPTSAYDGVGWTLQAEAGGYSGRVAVWDYTYNNDHFHNIQQEAPQIFTTTATNQNTGSGNSHNNLQPYVTLNYIIKT